MKRICYLVLIAAFLLALGVTVFAEETPTSGKFNDSVSWTFQGGVLTLSGTGPVDSPFLSSYPWQSFRGSVQKVIVQEGITSIGYLCFNGCQNLTEIQLPNSLETIGQQAFSLTAIEELTVPKNVHTIGDGKKDAFSQVVIGNASLENIFVDDANTHYYDIDGVLFCRDTAVLVCFPSQKKLDTYTVPEGIRGIGHGAFSGAALSSIALPESLKEIGPSAFHRTLITQITIPNSVTRIGGYAFHNCDQLQNITLPANVENINNDTFYHCEALESVTVLNPDCLFWSESNLFPKQATLIGYADSTLHRYAHTEGRIFQNIETGETVNYYREGGLIAFLPKDLAPSYPASGGGTFYDTETGECYGNQARAPIVTDPSHPTYQDIYNTTMEITKNCTTDREKAKAVMNWLNENITYVYNHSGGSFTTENLYLLWEASPRVGNCDVYTKFTCFMLSILKIPNATASGKNHGWAMALIDGEWIPIDSTNGWFGATPYEEDTSALVFCVGDVVCIIEDFTGVKMTSYGSCIDDTTTTNDIYIPDYVTHIYKKTAFDYRKYAEGQEKVTIRGEKGSYAETFVRENLQDYDITYEGTRFIARPHVHTPGEYQWSNSLHWQICSGCDTKLDYEAHAFDGCTDTLCETCGYTRSVFHAFLSSWEHGENGHWHKCYDCTATSTVEAHTWDTGVADGNALRYTCTVCARQKTEAVNVPTTVPPTTVPPTTVPPTTVPPTTVPPATVPPTTVPPTTVPPTTVPDSTTVPSSSAAAPTQQTQPGPAQPQPSGGPSALIWGILAAVLCLCGAGVFLFLRKRK